MPDGRSTNGAATGEAAYARHARRSTSATTTRSSALESSAGRASPPLSPTTRACSPRSPHPASAPCIAGSSRSTPAATGAAATAAPNPAPQPQHPPMPPWQPRILLRPRGRIPYTRIGGGYRFTEEHVVAIIRIFEEKPTDAPAPTTGIPQQRREPRATTAPVIELRARTPRRARIATHSPAV